MARGRPRKLDKVVVAEVVVTPAPSPAPVIVEPEPIETPADEELFEDLDDVPQSAMSLFDNAPSIPTVQPPSPVTIADADLEDEARRELARLLNQTIGLQDRAALLVKLAHHTDTKRAPVALRAIQEINALTGVTRERPADTMPMFQLPPDASVSITVEKVVK